MTEMETPQCTIHTEADGKQFIKCRECGYKELFPLPLPSQVVTFWLQDFSDRHADCGSEEKENGD